jgi:hypothetical protein
LALDTGEPPASVVSVVMESLARVCAPAWTVETAMLKAPENKTMVFAFTALVVVFAGV